MLSWAHGKYWNNRDLDLPGCYWDPGAHIPGRCSGALAHPGENERQRRMRRKSGSIVF